MDIPLHFPLGKPVAITLPRCYDGEAEAPASALDVLLELADSQLTYRSRYAMIAARALTPRSVPTVGLDHLHAPAVSVREQAAILGTRLRAERVCSFRVLVRDAESTPVIVARFFAFLY